MTLGQQQHQKQAMALGQEQLQGLAMLMKSLPELRAEVYAELERNPVIESVSNPLETPLSEVERRSRETDEPEPDYPEEDRYSSVEQASRSADEDYLERRQAFFDNQVSEETLQQHLVNQLPLSPIPAEDHPLAEVLIGDLDANGYYKGSLPDVAMVFQKSVAEVETLLAQIREFDPPGCGARDLRECYLAQTDAIDDVVMRERVRKLLVDRFDSLAAECAADPQLVAALKLMNGTPGRIFPNEKDRVEYVNPEITAAKRGEKWVPLMDERSVPEFRFSKQYLRILNDPNATAEAKAFVQEKLAAAKALKASIENRRSTISTVAEVIFERQQDFFEQGFKALKPMTEASVAEELGVADTTVSRAVRDKYVATPKGTIELRRFFTTAVKNAAGDEISQEAVLTALKALIDREDPHAPLSDEKLSSELKRSGHAVARRTIAKYRDKLGIPPASKRKT